MKKDLTLLIIAIIFLTSCSTQKNISGKPLKSITFLGEYRLPHKMQFNGTTVGGLSSIDYSKKEDQYYLICDDRSDLSPARYYKAKIFLSAKSIDSIRIIEAVYLLQKDGTTYPNKLENPSKVPDPEALRMNPVAGTIFWSSEGERIVRKDHTVLQDPSVNVILPNGKLIDTFPLPDNMRMKVTESGARQNGVFEGLAFSNNYETLFVAVEEPIYEDGPRAGLNDSSAWIRIIKYDVGTKSALAQYAYKIDPVVQEPISASAFKVNGVPDILTINDHQLLVTERSFSAGRLGCNIRIYIAELNGAENIAAITSLQQHPAIKPLQKKLLFNMDNLHRYIDNVEGATFGPVLPNGKRSLIFVADDNFDVTQKTQFLLFQVN